MTEHLGTLNREKNEMKMDFLNKPASINHRCCPAAPNCYFNQYVPRFEVFSGAWSPRNWSFTNLDGIMDADGRALLFIEMKHETVPLKDYFQTQNGQGLALFRLGKAPETYGVMLCIPEKAKDMRITHYALFGDGGWEEWKKGNLKDVNAIFKKWKAHVLTLPTIYKGRQGQSIWAKKGLIRSKKVVKKHLTKGPGPSK
jgi:hypothetical protein